MCSEEPTLTFKKSSIPWVRKGGVFVFDVLTVGAIAHDLEQDALDGRVQRIGMVDPLTVAMEIYARGKRRGFTASADAEKPRALFMDAMPSIDPNLITPFGLLLRKYVRGGILVGVEQPPLERMIRLTIAKRQIALEDDRGKKRKGVEEPVTPEEDDLAEDDIWAADDVVKVDLIIEIMGRHSNLVLVGEDGIVMESAKRVTAQMSRVRTILPRKPYTLPPVPDKPDPRALTSAGVESLLRGAKPETKVADLLVRGLRSISPQIGREAAFRLLGDTAATIEQIAPEQTRDLARTVRGLYEPMLTGAWDPHVYERDDAVVAYAALAFDSLAVDAEAVKVSSISEAIALSLDAGSGIKADSPKEHAQRRQRLIEAIDVAIGRVEGRLRSFREQHAKTAELEKLRTWGETIYAYLWQIQPGDTELVVEGERIPLDPSLSPKDVAQEYFERYRKAQKAGDQLPERIAENETERDYLLQLRLQASQADGFLAIEQLRQEFEEHTGGRQLVGEKHPQRGKKAQPKRVSPLIDLNGNMLYVGRSGKENEMVTFDIGGPNDTWLHARGVPGSHVIVRWVRPDDESEETIETAAAIAAYYSGSRESGTVEVDVAKRRDVRKIKGGGPGMVTYRNEYTIPVRPMSEADLIAAKRLMPKGS